MQDLTKYWLKSLRLGQDPCTMSWIARSDWLKCFKCTIRQEHLSSEKCSLILTLAVGMNNKDFKHLALGIDAQLVKVFAGHTSPKTGVPVTWF